MAFYSGGSGGGGQLSTNSDVTIAGVNDGHSLVFNSATSKWSNERLSINRITNLQSTLTSLDADITTKSQVVAIDHGAPDPDPADYPNGTIFFEKAA